MRSLWVFSRHFNKSRLWFSVECQQLTYLVKCDAVPSTSYEGLPNDYAIVSIDWRALTYSNATHKKHIRMPAKLFPANCLTFRGCRCINLILFCTSLSTDCVFHRIFPFLLDVSVDRSIRRSQIWENSEGKWFKYLILFFVFTKKKSAVFCSAMFHMVFVWIRRLKKRSKSKIVGEMFVNCRSYAITILQLICFDWQRHSWNVLQLSAIIIRFSLQFSSIFFFCSHSTKQNTYYIERAKKNVVHNCRNSFFVSEDEKKVGIKTLGQRLLCVWMWLSGEIPLAIGKCKHTKNRHEINSTINIGTENKGTGLKKERNTFWFNGHWIIDRK